MTGYGSIGLWQFSSKENMDLIEEAKLFYFENYDDYKPKKKPDKDITLIGPDRFELLHQLGKGH